MQSRFVATLGISARVIPALAYSMFVMVPAHGGLPEPPCAAPLSENLNYLPGTQLAVNPDLSNIFKTDGNYLVMDVSLGGITSVATGSIIPMWMSGPKFLSDGTWSDFVLEYYLGDLQRIKLHLTGNTVSSLELDWRETYVPSTCGIGGGPLVVHQLAEATPDFTNLVGGDRVYAATQLASSCTGYRTINHVASFNAHTGVTTWEFNFDGVSYEMDGAYGLALDEQRDRVYVTTERRNSVSQSSVWAIDVLTGTLDWKVNAGRFQTQPAQASDRLYVANLAGELKALSKDDGSEIWSLSTGGIPFTVDPVYVDDPDAGQVVYSIDFFGRVRRANDTGASTDWAWTRQLPLSNGGSLVVSALAVDVPNKRVYAADDNGVIHLLDADTGDFIECRTAGEGDGDIDQIILLPESLSPSRMIATSTYPAPRISLYSTIPVGAPKVISPIPNTPLLRADQGLYQHVTDLNTYFEDGDGDPLVFSVQNIDNPDTVDVTLSGPGNQTLSVTALKHGTTNITIRASDLETGTGEGFADDTFFALTVGLLEGAAVQSDTLFTNHVTGMDIVFTTPSMLELNSRIASVFPAAFDTGLAELGSFSAGGALLEIDAQTSSSVRLQVVSGLIPENTMVSFRLNGIRTPLNPGNSGPFSFMTSDTFFLDATTVPGLDFSDAPDVLLSDGFEGTAE